jgi:deoxynucleoside triphosphate triphosphohydrolase SAMHD1
VFEYNERKDLETYITSEAIVEQAKSLAPSSFLSYSSDLRAADDDDLTWGETEEVNEVDEVADKYEESEIEGLLKELRAEDVVVTMSTMHYGMKDKNPLDYVSFYTKRRPNGALLSSFYTYTYLTEA